MNVGSLFSGIGGLDLGLERAGFRVIWQAEVDEYASRVLAQHWPHVPNLGDVTKVDWSTIERPDIVCAGFPCQPVSSAGGKRAEEDDYWLWPEVTRAVRHLRPAVILLENVSGLLTRGMGTVLGDLASLGYDAEWESIPAAAVGAPHRRDRVFILAYPDRQPGECDGFDLPSARGTVSPPRSRIFRRGVVGAYLADVRSGSSHWAFEPDLDRVAHGVPDRVDRMRCLGNAVVPQVAEFVGRCLAAHIDGSRCESEGP